MRLLLNPNRSESSLRSEIRSSLPLQLMAVLLLLLLGSSARAQSDLLFTLNQILVNAPPGSEVIFTGTLANTTAAPLYLNGIQFEFDSIAGTYLSGDANVFFNDDPASLAAAGTAGDTYNGPIFGVNIAADTPVSTYNGTVSLSGGADGSAMTLLNAQNFGVLAAVPEGRSWLDVSMGLTLVGVAVRRRRRMLQSNTDGEFQHCT